MEAPRSGSTLHQLHGIKPSQRYDVTYCGGHACTTTHRDAATRGTHHTPLHHIPRAVAIYRRRSVTLGSDSSP
eukprot:9459408-Pyramimonas_sp.AAC.1